MARQLRIQDHLVAQRRGPRRPAKAAACAIAREEQERVIEAAATGFTIPREHELNRIKAALRRYVRRLGIGQEFQACDFTTHLHDHGRAPDRSLVDPRCTGGMFLRLRRRKVLRVMRHRPNAGNPHTGYGSTTRPVYRVKRLPLRNDL